MTNQVKNEPELRFPGFSSEWEENQLSKLTQLLKDGTHGTHKDVENGAWLLSAKNIRNNNIVLNESDRKISYDDYHKIYKNYQLQKNDLLLSIVGTIGRTAIVKDPTNLVFQRSVAIIRFENQLSNLFFLYLFQTHTFKKKLLRNQVVSAQPGLYLGDLGRFFVKYPSNYKEQEKIGNFFSKLDRQIELEEKKLELVEQQKRGYMQKLFSQELRFKDQDGNHYPKWEKKFIKDIFIFENNRRKPITSSLREKGLYPYYGATGIIDYVKDYLFNNEERLLIGEDGAKWGQFEKSSFIANGQYWVNNHAHVVKSNNHNLYFMNYYLNFKELRTFVTGNAPAKLTHANLCNINLEIPCLNEQGKISALLKSIDNKMKNQINKIVLLKRRKQGLLQKMFV